MYTKILRFLKNRLFKPIPFKFAFFPGSNTPEFLTPLKSRRTRTPKKELRCTHCGFLFQAFTYRQLVCKAVRCVKARRKLLYDARQEHNRSAREATTSELKQFTVASGKE